MVAGEGEPQLTTTIKGGGGVLQTPRERQWKKK